MAKAVRNNAPKLLATFGKAYPQSPSPASLLTVTKVGEEASIKLKCYYYEVIYVRWVILVWILAL